MRLRQRVLQVAEQHGQEIRLRTVREALLPTGEIRNRRDDRALSLLIASVVGRAGCCVDVGAHRGSVLREMLRIAPDGQHVAIEPLPGLAERLRREFPDVTVHQCALADTPGEATMITWPEAPAYSSLQWVPPREDTRHVYPDDAGEPLAVATARLDDLLADHPPPTFIKIDVEGAEQQVLAGAEGLLSRHRPVVAFEHGLGCLRHGAEAGNSVFDPLTAAGLRIFDMDGGGPYSREGFRSEVLRGARWFFFAAP